MRSKLDLIDWKNEAKHQIVTNTELANIYAKLKSTRTQIDFSNKTLDFTTKTFALYRNKNKTDILGIFYLNKPGEYLHFSTNTFDDKKNSNEVSGSKAFRLLSSKFNALNGVSLNQAFGSVSEEIKRCIPKQFTYFNEQFLNKKLLYSSIDACSQYPANMRGLLPDAKTAVIKEGTVEPDEEYRFAFYVNSGHCAEYNVFDTHNWINAPMELWGSLFRMRRNEKWPLQQNLSGDKDITILMKASNYELTEALEYFYKLKESIKDHDSEDYLNAKLVMNAAIGSMHLKNYTRNKFAHLVAICLGRANQKLLDMALRISIKDIAQIVVDGILYRGPAFGVTERVFGAFNQEFVNCEGLITNYNKFIVMKDNKVVKFKQGNCNKTIAGKDIREEDIKTLEDQRDWVLVDDLMEIRHYE